MTLAGFSKVLKFVTTLPTALLGLVGIFGAQASADLIAWNEARTRDTAEAYAEFAIRYPDSKFAWSACQRLSKPQDAPIAGAPPILIAFPIPSDGVKAKSEFHLVYT